MKKKIQGKELTKEQFQSLWRGQVAELIFHCKTEAQLAAYEELIKAVNFISGESFDQFPENSENKVA